MKVFLLLNAIGLAAVAVNADNTHSRKSDELCTPDQVQSIHYELDWNDGPNGSGISDYSLNGFCQCHNAECSLASCYDTDAFPDGQYLFCEQIAGGACGMNCAYIDSIDCPDADAGCPALATAPTEEKAKSG